MVVPKVHHKPVYEVVDLRQGFFLHLVSLSQNANLNSLTAAHDPIRVSTHVICIIYKSFSSNHYFNQINTTYFHQVDSLNPYAGQNRGSLVVGLCPLLAERPLSVASPHDFPVSLTVTEFFLWAACCPWCCFRRFSARFAALMKSLEL